MLGHSFGTIVALELALRHPGSVAGLALLSGYYFPTARVDVPLLSPPAIPVLGDVMRHTVSPLLGRLSWPAIRRAPVRPGAGHAGLRRAQGHDAAAGADPGQRVGERPDGPDGGGPAGATTASWRMPVAILAGCRGPLRRHRAAVPGSCTARSRSSRFQAVAGAGHMVHHAAPRAALAAIATRRGRRPSQAGRRGARGRARAPPPRRTTGRNASASGRQRRARGRARTRARIDADPRRVRHDPARCPAQLLSHRGPPL